MSRSSNYYYDVMRTEAETVQEQAFRVSSKRPPVDEHTGSRLLNFAPRSPPRPSHVYIDGLENRRYNVLPLRTHRRVKVSFQLKLFRAERSYRQSC